MQVDHISKKMNTNYKKHRQKWQLSVTLSKEKKKNKKNTSLQVSKQSKDSPGVFKSTKEDFTQKMNPKPKNKTRITLQPIMRNLK